MADTDFVKIINEGGGEKWIHQTTQNSICIGCIPGKTWAIWYEVKSTTYDTKNRYFNLQRYKKKKCGIKQSLKSNLKLLIK